MPQIEDENRADGIIDDDALVGCAVDEDGDIIDEYSNCAEPY